MYKRYSTQWIGQFAVASELIRRNYLVSLPLGNLPIRDMLCQSPQGESFSVQVKSLRSKTYFPFQNNLINVKIPDLYLVFVYIPDKLNQWLEYFILSHEQFLNVWQIEQNGWKDRERLRGRPYKEWANGIGYKTLSNSVSKSNWEVLPK